MTAFVVSGGQTLSGTTLNPGDTMSVLSGGQALSTTILSGGQLTTFSGGTAVSTIDSGGDTVTAGGLDISATVTASGSLTVSSGGTASGTHVGFRGVFSVLAGGTAIGAVNTDTGVENVAGLNLSGIISGQSMTVLSGGVDSASTIVSGGSETVLSGGTAINTFANGGTTTGSYLTVSAGGTSVSATIVGETNFSLQGTALNATVSGGGLLAVVLGGTASGTTLVSGGRQYTGGGGIAISTLASVSGLDIVGGVDISAILTSEGEMLVGFGGVASATQILLGGYAFVSSGGTAIATTVSTGAGAQLIIDAGGSSVSAILIGGGIERIDGGAAFSTTVSGGGDLAVQFGGTAIAATVSTSGSLFIELGGTASGTVLTGSGFDLIDLGGVAIGTVMGQAGNLGAFEQVMGTATGTNIQIGSQSVGSGGVASSTVLSGGGRQSLLSSGTAVGTMLSGGSEIVSSGGTAVSTLIGQNSSMTLQTGGLASGGITFSGPGARLEVDGSVMPTATISTLVPSDSFDFTGVAFDSGGTATVAADNTLQVNENAQTYSLQLDQSYAGFKFVLSRDSGNGTLVTETCFCRGTRILTERGEIVVEDLSVGDRVKTLSGQFKPIRWIGFGRDLVTRANKIARPIIVRRGALADNVPHRDLYLTHGHALYFSGALIPVEHLVNHHSIAWDDTARVVEYYHIELDEHDVVLAEGAACETYYEASNRALFHNTREGSDAVGEKPTYVSVLHDGETVERIWAALFERVGVKRAECLTNDPDLHLVINGTRLDPSDVADAVYTFTLKQPPEMAVLHSRSAVPSLLGRSRHEHRRLGVAIRQLIVHGAGIMTCVDHSAPLLAMGGCYAPEDGHSWTDGELLLPAGMFACGRGSLTLVVHTKRQDMRYPIAAAAAFAA